MAKSHRLVLNFLNFKLVVRAIINHEPYQFLKVVKCSIIEQVFIEGSADDSKWFYVSTVFTDKAERGDGRAEGGTP